MKSENYSNVLCGAGAVGSTLTLLLAPHLISLMVIDDDKLEVHNIPSTIYFERDVGRMKATVISEVLMRRNQNLKCYAYTKSLAQSSSVIPKDAELVLDCFDNIDARKATMGANTLHIGVSADRTGAVTWNENYIPPDDYLPRGENPVCTNELGMPIILATVSIAYSIVLDYLRDGKRRNALITQEFKPIYY